MTNTQRRFSVNVTIDHLHHHPHGSKPSCVSYCLGNLDKPGVRLFIYMEGANEITYINVLCATQRKQVPANHTICSLIRVCLFASLGKSTRYVQSSKVLITMPTADRELSPHPPGISGMVGRLTPAHRS